MRMRNPLSPRLYVPVGAVLIGLTFAAAGAAFAASLGVTSKALTVFQKASTIPPSTCTLPAVADAIVAEEAPTTTVGTALPELLAVQSRDGRDGRSLVRFDISSCVPNGAHIVSANLRLYLSDAPSANRTYLVHRVTAAWAENSVTWNNQPGIASSITSSTATGTTDGVTLQWSVGSDVQLFVGGSATNNGWRLRDQTEDSGTARTGVFPSDESTTGEPKPQLVITYYP